MLGCEMERSQVIGHHTELPATSELRPSEGTENRLSDYYRTAGSGRS